MDAEWVELTDAQADELEAELEAYDDAHMRGEHAEGRIRIGLRRDGRMVAGLDACMTAFHILYVSTVFVAEEYRRQGLGARLMAEMERRAKKLGADTVRLDTFDWQGRDFYAALGYTQVGCYENENDHYAEYFFLKRI